MRVRPRRLTIGVAAATLVLAACGGGSDDGSSGDSGAATPESGEQLPETAEGDAAASDVAATDDGSGGDAAAAPASGQVDLVGPDVVAASDIETNPLPSVVLDDVSRGMKVNFRNLVPQDKPILLWAYAPH